MYALKKNIGMVQYDLDTAYPLIKGTIWVKYELDWRKGREDKLWTRIFHKILQ